MTDPREERAVRAGRLRLGRLRCGPRPLLGLALVFLLTSLGAPSRVREDLSERCDALARTHELSGVMLVAHGDEVLLERAYGLADLEPATANTLATRFHVASLTKAFVAFATLRLVDEERVQLEAPAARYLPVLEGTDAGRATLHQLLTHTSGLPHYEGLPELERAQRAYDEKELLGLLAGMKAVAAPGAQLHYSGPGYLVLGLVLEAATGEGLPALMRRLVLDPLGLEHTELVDGSSEPGPHATLLERREGQLRRANARHASTLRAAGGVITTARDLYTFARAIQSGALLSESSHAVLVTPVLRSYACGLIVYRSPWSGGTWARHMGSMDGVAAHLVFGLDSPWVSLVLSNVGGTKVDDLDDGLLAAAMSKR